MNKIKEDIDKLFCELKEKEIYKNYVSVKRQLEDNEEISNISKLQDKNQIVLKLQEKIKAKYGEETGNEFSRLFFSVCVLLKCSIDENYKKEVINEKKKLTDKLD